MSDKPDGFGSLSTSEIQHFWSKIAITANPDKCWNYSEWCDRDGYGKFNFKDKCFYGHRVAYELTKGEIPVGLLVCHTCDNPSCCNPNHLFLGTHTINAHDRDSKGRHVELKGELHGAHKLTEQQVLDIRNTYAKGGVTIAEIARQVNVRHQTVSAIIHRKIWRHI